MLYNQIVSSDFGKRKSDFGFFKELVQHDCFNIVRHSEDLAVLEEPRFRAWSTFDNFLIFGTGGSSLGGQCIYSVAEHSSNFGRSDKKKLKFVCNLDADSLSHIFENINAENTGFLFISKSGETLETIAQLLATMDSARHHNNFRDHFAVITEDKDSTLREIAKKNDFLCLDHPKTIGGRYSVFSLVGMVPAMLCGADPRSIRIGGRRVLDNFGNSIYKIQEGADFVYHNFQEKIRNHVSFIYSEKLVNFGAWLAQLYAESSGKDGKGITPITAIGSVDQHSQLQLYLDGTQDKCFTFFYEKQEKQIILNGQDIPPRFEYLRGKGIAEIFGSQYEATQKVLVQNGCHVRKIEIPPINGEILGALFMHFMVEAACVCHLMEVNPFDQPAVEKGKVLTKQLLGGGNEENKKEDESKAERANDASI